MIERLYNGVFRVDRPCMANVRRIDQGALPMVLAMNRTGIRVDVDHFRRLGQQFADQCRQVEEEIRVMVGHPVNPTSGDQVAKLLFDELGLRPPGLGDRPLKMTKKQLRPAADDEVLSALLGQHAVVEKIVYGRELVKLIGTYCGPIPAAVGSDGRVRPTFKMLTARTGRLSAENPPVQQIPIRSEDGRQLRAGFVASPGCVLVGLDLSQIELVWAAELAQDPIMLEVFDLGQDLHVRTACALFRLDYDRIAPLWAAYKRGGLTGVPLAEMRDFEMNKRLPAKTLSFAILYGVTPMGLVPQILAAGGPLYTAEECEDYIRLWFSLFSGIKTLLETQYSRVRRYGMVWTAFGRPRVVPEIHSALQGVRNQGLRQSGNHPVQGSAGDNLKLIMGEIQEGPVSYFRSLGETCDPVLSIHDELVFEVGAGVAQDFTDWAHFSFCNAVRPMRCKVKASASIGGTWADLK